MVMLHVLYNAIIHNTYIHVHILITVYEYACPQYTHSCVHSTQDEENVPLEMTPALSPQQGAEITNGVGSQQNVSVVHVNGTQKSSSLVEPRVRETFSSGRAIVKEPSDSRAVMSPQDVGIQRVTSPKFTSPPNTKGVADTNLRSTVENAYLSKRGINSDLMGSTSPEYRATTGPESPENRPTKGVASPGVKDPKSPGLETGIKSTDVPLCEKLKVAIETKKVSAVAGKDLESPIPSLQKSIPIDERLTVEFKQTCAVAGVTISHDGSRRENKIAAATVLSSPHMITPPMSGSSSSASVAYSSSTSQLAVIIPDKHILTSSDPLSNNFSPHTPSSSPSTFSPHTPLSSVYSPDSQSTPVHLVQANNGGNVFRREDLKFECLSPNEPVSVTVTWVESPNNFVVSLFEYFCLFVCLFVCL